MYKNVIFSFFLVCFVFVMGGCASDKKQPVVQKKEVKVEKKEQIKEEPKIKVPEQVKEEEPVQEEESVVDVIAEFNEFAKENPIYFDFDSADVDERSIIKKYKEQLSKLNDLDGVELTISGYCDPRGKEEYNNNLGNRRAQAVSEIVRKIVSNKVGINNVSFGKNKYTEYTSDIEENYRMNRKVEVVASK